MALPFFMPMRNERLAPKFDTSRPRELPRFFEDFEELICRTQITENTEIKKFLVRYTEFDTEQQWKALPEFRNNSSYAEFKAAILSYYPEPSNDFAYSFRDLELLICEYQRLGIATIANLCDYHRRFIMISTWLIARKQSDDLEQRRIYIRAFPSPMFTAITNRLQLKFPEHHPSIPYPVTEVYEAARFILQGTSSSQLFQPISPSTTDNVLKIANIAPIIPELTKSIVQALKARSRSPNISEYSENKYQNNRNHLASAPAVCPINKPIISHRPESQPVQQPSTHERLAQLEAELARLRAEQPAIPSNVRTIAQRPNATISERTKVQAASTIKNATKPEVINLPEPLIIATENIRTQTIENNISPTSTEEISNSPPNSIFPVLNRTGYLPPTEPNFAGLRKRPAISKRTTPNPEPLSPKKNNISETENHLAEIPVIITQRELLSIAPAVRSKVNSAVTFHRISDQDRTTSSELVTPSTEDFPSFAIFAFSRYCASFSTRTRPLTLAANLPSISVTVRRIGSKCDRFQSRSLASLAEQQDLISRSCPSFRNIFRSFNILFFDFSRDFAANLTDPFTHLDTYIYCLDPRSFSLNSFDLFSEFIHFRTLFADIDFPDIYILFRNPRRHRTPLVDFPLRFLSFFRASHYFSEHFCDYFRFSPYLCYFLRNLRIFTNVFDSFPYGLTMMAS